MIASRQIGNRFRIDDLEHDLLGRGGMGAVYRATDTLTGETVAVKVLNQTSEVSQTSEVFARFVREGEALRQLNHPNIVRMLAAVEEGGRHYLVIELVPGGSLRDLLEKEGRLQVLLSRTPAGRYEVHELLRQYGAEKLAEDPDEERAARDRHCACYAGLLREKEPHLFGRSQRITLAEIAAEVDNVRLEGPGRTTDCPARNRACAGCRSRGAGARSDTRPGRDRTGTAGRVSRIGGWEHAG